MSTEPTTSKTSAETTGWFVKDCCIPGRLEGKLVLITGANTGIGKCTASEVARRGAKVIMACRSIERAQAALDNIIETYGAENPKHLTAHLASPMMKEFMTPVTKDQFIIEQLDLGSLQSVRDFAARIKLNYPKIDFLVNNAGQYIDKYSKTVDGFETTIGVNHFGPFLLTELLLPEVKAAAPSRIVLVSSIGQRWAELFKPDLQLPEAQWTSFKAYAMSKLTNAMYAKQLAKHLEGSNVTVASLHPGAVKTELARDVTGSKKFMAQVINNTVGITPWSGAQTTLYCLQSANIKSGGYYSNCAPGKYNALVDNDEECKWLYDKTAEMVKLSTTQD